MWINTQVSHSSSPGFFDRHITIDLLMSFSISPLLYISVFSSVIHIVMEKWNRWARSNFSLVCDVHFRTNTIGKGMNLSLQASGDSKSSLDVAQRQKYGASSEDQPRYSVVIDLNRKTC